MKPCPKCGGEHRGWEVGICRINQRKRDEAAAEPALVVHKRAVVANAKPVVANTESIVVANTSRHGKHADPEKRREYMREFMRAKRAAAKKGKS